MPSLLHHAECRACGHRHNFCLPTGKVVPGAEYTYVCPETTARATLRSRDPGETVRHYPQGAVTLAAQVAAVRAAA